MILQTECIAFFPTLAFTITRRKKLDLWKTAFPLAFKKPQVPAISIETYPMSACAVYATSGLIRPNKSQESRPEIFFCSFARLFVFISDCVCLYFVSLNLWNTKKWHLTCNPYLKVFELFKFSRAQVTQVKFHLLSNACGSARESVIGTRPCFINGPLIQVNLHLRFVLHVTNSMCRLGSLLVLSSPVLCHEWCLCGLWPAVSWSTTYEGKNAPFAVGVTVVFTIRGT